jgi:hypothetical protein
MIAIRTIHNVLMLLCIESGYAYHYGGENSYDVLIVEIDILYLTTNRQNNSNVMCHN